MDMTKTPAGLLAELREVAETVKRYESRTHLNYQREITELKARASTLRKHWRALGSKPLVAKMSAIVETTVDHYKLDFYMWDLQAMAQHPETPFIWVVREMGTHLVWLEGDKETVKRNRESLASILLVWGYERCTFYHVDQVSGTMQRLSKVDNVSFKVKEAA